MIGTLEDLTTAALNETSRQCLEAAQAVVCHSSFPFCFSNVTQRKVCSRTCDLFRMGGACANVIDAATHPEVVNAIFSNCDSRVDEAGAFPECIHVSLNTPDSKFSPAFPVSSFYRFKIGYVHQQQLIFVGLGHPKQFVLLLFFGCSCFW